MSTNSVLDSVLGVSSLEFSFSFFLVSFRNSLSFLALGNPVEVLVDVGGGPD